MLNLLVTKKVSSAAWHSISPEYAVVLDFRLVHASPLEDLWDVQPPRVHGRVRGLKRTTNDNHA